MGQSIARMLEAPAKYLKSFNPAKEKQSFPSDGWVPQQLVQVMRDDAGKLVKVDPDFSKSETKPKKRSYTTTQKDGMTTLTITN
jgi:hypothetical protein